MGFKDGSAQLSYQFLSIFRGEQFDRSKPLLRQAEIRVGLNSESDIQDIETNASPRDGFSLLKSESDIQDISVPNHYRRDNQKRLEPEQVRVI